jgi:hypothetical protein
LLSFDVAPSFCVCVDSHDLFIHVFRVAVYVTPDK